MKGKKANSIIVMAVLIVFACCRFVAADAVLTVIVPINVDTDEVFKGMVNEETVIYDLWSNPIVASDREFHNQMKIKNIFLDNEEIPLNDANGQTTTINKLRFSEININVKGDEECGRIFVQMPELMLIGSMHEPLHIDNIMPREQSVNLLGGLWHMIKAQENPVKEDGTKSVLISMEPIGAQMIRPETMRLYINGLAFDGSTHLRGGESFSDYHGAYFVFSGVPADLEIDWNTVSVDIFSLMYVQPAYVYEAECGN